MPYTDFPGSYVCFVVDDYLRVVALREDGAQSTWSFVIETNAPDVLGNPSWRRVTLDDGRFQYIMQALLEGQSFKSVAEWRDEVAPGILRERKKKIENELSTLSYTISNMNDPEEESDTLKHKLLLERNRLMEELQDIDYTLAELTEDSDG